jgi:transcriptional regulator with XRE-family HTH domain
MPRENGHQQDEQTIWRDFGIEVQQLRLKRGLSVPKVVELSGGEISRDQIHKIEHGGWRQRTGGPWETPNPRDDKLAALANVLGVRVEDWFKVVGRYNERARTRAARKQSPTDRIAQLEEDLRETKERNVELEERQRRIEETLRNAGILGGETATPPRPRRRRSPG